MVVSVLLKIEFGHTQISVPKIGIPMSKTACINPCLYIREDIPSRLASSEPSLIEGFFCIKKFMKQMTTLLLL